MRIFLKQKLTTFCTEVLKATSEKKYKEPENTTLALFLACKAAISNKSLPVPNVYWKPQEFFYYYNMIVDNSYFNLINLHL